jgi:3-hydroxyacyl-CoA dehydrogenase/enoyl-CoA hydratase/3-hydroxybutyryl-CoA epimerase
MPYLNEAGHLLEEGVSMKDLDDACLNFGMPMGPCRLLDEIGIDVAEKVAKIIHKGLGDRAKPSTNSHMMSEAKFYGKKTKKGFYLYDDSGKEIGPNEEVTKRLKQDKKMDEVDIQMRVFLPMINEAAYILQEGIVSHARFVDLGLIFGTGFPPFRGGLLRYADSEGPQRILRAIEGFANSVDAERYRPAQLLHDLVRDKKKFYEYGM